MLRVLIWNKKKAMKHGKGEHEYLLGLMLHSNEQVQNNTETEAKVKGMALEDVMEECKIFYFAGHETTSGLLTMVLLSMHPSWQSRAREEVQQMLRGNLPNYENISQLKTVSSLYPKR